MGKKKITALYVRVSTVEQAREGHSVGEQSERLQKYCEVFGWDNYKLYVDPGVSGTTLDRPALQEMIKDIKAKKIERVLVYKLDRLSRSQKDTLNLIDDIFLKNKVDFISINENFDTSTPLGRAMIGMLAVFSQLEHEQIKQRVKMGRDARAKQGKFHGSSQVPIGYDYVDGELVTNEKEKEQVQKIFQWYSEMKGPSLIAETLNSAGMYHKNGKWLPHTIRQILGKQTYLGYLYYNGDWYKGTHEAIISQELFDKVQVIRNRKIKEFSEHNRRTGRATSYLGGYVICEHCGAKYVKQNSVSTKKGEKYYIPYYVCASRVKKNPKLINDPNCKNKRFRMEEIESRVFEELKKVSPDFSEILDSEDFYAIRDAIGMLVEDITVNDDDIKINWIY